MMNLAMGDVSHFVESLSNNPWFVLITAGCTMVAVPLALVFYLKSKKEKLPRYAVRSNNLIKGTKAVIPALSVHFQGHGEPIDNLTVSKVVFWNAGRETIRKQEKQSNGRTSPHDFSCDLNVLVHHPCVEHLHDHAIVPVNVLKSTTPGSPTVLGGR